MNQVHTPALAQLIDARQLVTRLTALAKKQEEQGRISHSMGVRSALKLIRRDLAKRPVPAKEGAPPN